MMQSGEYYVGDLCYVMNPQWDEFCVKNCGDVCDGEIILSNGVKVASYRTAYGDGCYTDQQGREYGVDAGLIGCIRIEDINDPEALISGGQTIVFTSDFETSYDEGVIIFGNIKIDTDPSPDYDEEDMHEED